MLFSVIYSADVPEGVNVEDYTPPQAEDLWAQTEGDEGYEYSYLENSWENGSHRKWTALLTRDQFDQFVSALGLYAEDVLTLGSLGGTGFRFRLVAGHQLHERRAGRHPERLRHSRPGDEEADVRRAGLAAGAAGRAGPVRTKPTCSVMEKSPEG